MTGFPLPSQRGSPVPAGTERLGEHVPLWFSSNRSLARISGMKGYCIEDLSPPPGLGAMPALSTLAGMPTISGPLPIVPTISGPLPTVSTMLGPLPTLRVHPPIVPPGGVDAAPSVASVMCNLLSVGGVGPTTRSPGVYVGEGLLPVPVKLAERIQRWDFVDMAELLPEYWGVVPGMKLGVETPNTSKPAGKKKVTNIMTWVQCFAMYTSVIAAKHPEATPELMAYLICILRVSQDFGGMAWVNYDSAFCRQAAATANYQWLRINPSLYSICFAGSVRTSTRCDLCLGLTHRTKECPMVEDPDPEMGSRLKAIGSVVLAMSQPRAWTPQNTDAPPRAPWGEICRNFNNRCNFKWCCFRHMCRVCGGPQPALECCERARPSERQQLVPPSGGKQEP